MQNDINMNEDINNDTQDELKYLKKRYSYTGLSYCIYMAVIMIAVVAAQLLVRELLPDVYGTSIATMLLGTLPMWIVGTPVCYLLLRRKGFTQPAVNKVKLGKLLQYFMIGITCMFVGNLIGNVLASIISSVTGTEIQNSTMDIIGDQNMVVILILVVIVGPIVEELLFRKLLIDAIGVYSPSHAVFLSGIMFGLFHMNLYQFFYAAMLGMIFAYVYMISGQIKYTIIMHQIVNFMGGFMPMLCLSLMKQDYITQLAEFGDEGPDAQLIFEMLSDPGVMLYGVHICIYLLCGFIGVICFALNIGKMKLYHGNPVLKFRHTILNPGMIAFVVVCILLMILNMLPS